MPELPDIVVYIGALEQRILGARLEKVRIASPFLLRTVEPPVSESEGRTVTRLQRIGKRIGIGFDNDVWLVIHLMIAGRLHWKPKPPPLTAKRYLASLDFSTGSVLITEAGTERRASIEMARGVAGIEALHRGGVEPLDATFDDFLGALRRENHTLKRSLTDPRLFSGVGNAYSDEILHRAKLSPAMLTAKLSDEDARKLWETTRVVLLEWVERLKRDTGGEFPDKVTAFRKEMSVHGRYGKPCPACGTKVERIRYASNETNYCPTCQTGGKILADRAFSRLLGPDWHKRMNSE